LIFNVVSCVKITLNTLENEPDSINTPAKHSDQNPLTIAPYFRLAKKTDLRIHQKAAADGN
jgi:hypothetical protein